MSTFDIMIRNKQVTLVPMKCYDDFVAIELAARYDGVVLTNDRYTDCKKALCDITPGKSPKLC